MFVVANLVGSTIQITTLPLPVLSTLQAVRFLGRFFFCCANKQQSGLVFNSICATLILGEPFTRYSLIGTILVAAGAVLIATFGALPEPSHTLSQLLHLLARHQFILWMAGTGILVSLILLALWIFHVFFHSSSSSSSPQLRFIRGMAYGFISGILSAHSLLVAKSAVELLVRTIVDRINQFNHWESWVILLSLVALALSQLYYLHRGLKLCSTSVLYPFVFCIYNIIAILDGLIYFRQTSRLPPLHAALIALGTVILLTGVFALSWRLDDDPSTKPAVAQTSLTPGMGFVHDTTEDGDSIDAEYGIVDEEAGDVGETAPLLANGSPLSPTAKHNTILGATRLRRQTVAEADEIWDELQDADRRYSVAATRRASAVRTFGSDDHDAEDPDENTALLRCDTTKTFKGRRRRGSRASSVSVGHSGSWRGDSRGNEGTGLREWWKRKWWKGSEMEDGEEDGGEGEEQRRGGGSVMR